MEMRRRYIVYDSFIPHSVCHSFWWHLKYEHWGSTMCVLGVDLGNLKKHNCKVVELRKKIAGRPPRTVLPPSKRTETTYYVTMYVLHRVTVAWGASSPLRLLAGWLPLMLLFLLVLHWPSHRGWWWRSSWSVSAEKTINNNNILCSLEINDQPTQRNSSGAREYTQRLKTEVWRLKTRLHSLVSQFLFLLLLISVAGVEE